MARHSFFSGPVPGWVCTTVSSDKPQITVDCDTRRSLKCMEGISGCPATLVAAGPIVGCGANLLVYSTGPPEADSFGNDGGGLLAKFAAFEGHRVHGIASGRTPGGSGRGLVLAVHGDRLVKVIHFSASHMCTALAEQIGCESIAFMPCT